MPPFLRKSVRLVPEVAQAIAERRPIVALESSVLAQGLPIPANREAASRMEAAVRSHDAVPAITGVVRGVPTVGLEPDELERFLRREGVRKVSARDIPIAVASKVDGATTVAASIALAALGGVTVFSTGGIGGVHRGAPLDESADLLELSRTRVVCVCAGAKSILDLPATWERLETLGIPVVGYRTDELPGFFAASTGIRLTARADTAAQIADMFNAHVALGRQQALLVVVPPPPEHALDRSLVDAAVKQALTEATRAGVGGAALTPFLLDSVTKSTGGSSLPANLALLEANAAVAAQVAAAMCS
ncbi:MAG TPA: pseudouridine-5'-phosphate glycosidase [Gemmatimonadaceae bacterium]|nr:pseudouridine-5'-phosphate glycosidase [Gemmatimonadaceae bacterium]